MVVDAPTPVVVTGNDWLLDPSGIVTLAGTVTAVPLLASVTTAPPVGAVPVSVRTPVTAVPPSTELDDNTTLASATVVGAVVAVESAHPDTTNDARTATAAARRVREPKALRCTTDHFVKDSTALRQDDGAGVTGS
jgi:hypothetical protein